MAANTRPAPAKRKRDDGAAAAADHADHAEGPLADPGAHFGLPWEGLHAFVRGSTRTVEELGFLDPGRPDRFVVVSVDPAGGGLLSEEAFVVFLVCGDRFGLLTARMVPGHSQRYGFSMVPLIFVLSLLHTVRAVRATLEGLHAARRRGAFTMPPVLVLIENNYAYGAATYMQMLWFLRQRQRRVADLADVEIVFASPVYGLDPLLVARYTELRALQNELQRMAGHRQAAMEAVRAAWLAHRRRGMNLARFLQTVNRTLQQEARDVGAPDPTVLDARAADARRAAEVLAEMVGEAFDDDAERAAVLDGWAAQGGAMVRSVAAQQAVRRHQQALQDRVRAVQKGIDAHLARHTDRDHGGHHEFVRLAPLPPRHTLDAANDHRIRAEPGALWDAGKRLVGEWTHEAQKVLGYRQFLALARRPVPYFSVLVLRRPPAAVGGAGGPAPAPCGPEMRAADHEDRDLVDGPRALACVYQQWRRLAVWVHPDDPQVPVRVAGKQPVREEPGPGGVRGRRRPRLADDGPRTTTDEDAPPPPVHKDDAWMAFAIGLQWCTRFTQLLPSAAHRLALVDYMRQLWQAMERALVVSLRDADGEGDGDPPPAGAGGPPARPAPPAAPPAPPAPPPPLSDDERDALVVCTAFANAALRVCTACVVLVRRLVLAYAVHGHQPSAGWRLSFVEREVAAGGAGGSQRRWNEALNRELLALPSADVAARLGEVRRAFALPVRTVRLVCGSAPGPRYAWPGVLLPRDAHLPPPRGRRPATDLADVLAALRRLVAVLRGAVGRCEDRHADHHPVLATPETRHLLSLLLQRIAGQVDDLDALVARDGTGVVPAVVRNTAAGDGVPALNRQAQRPPPPPVVPAPAMPHILFVVYGQLADDVRFLRRLVAHGRGRLLGDGGLPAGTARVECPVEGAASVSLRVNVARQHVNWRRAFRTLFPAKYQAVEAAARAERAALPRTTVVQSRLWFDAHG